MSRDNERYIRQGDIFWATVTDESGSEREIVHPQVVIQDTLINNSRIDSVVVCGLTTNMKKAYEPGNVLLEEGEANLDKVSIVVTAHISLVKKSELGEYIGRLSSARIGEIFKAMELLQALSR